MINLHSWSNVKQNVYTCKLTEHAKCNFIQTNIWFGKVGSAAGLITIRKILNLKNGFKMRFTRAKLQRNTRLLVHNLAHITYTNFFKFKNTYNNMKY